MLISALFHALWNTVAKSVGDRWVSSALIGVGYLIGGLIIVIIRPLPAVQSWPNLLISVALQVVYLLLLTSAYQYGDLGRLYPLMRGMGPLLVSVVAIGFLGERLHGWGVAGLAILLGGLAALALSHGLPRRGHGIGLALLTGCCIAAYSLVDGIGVRRSGEPYGYAGWLFLIQGPLLILVARIKAGGQLVSRMRPYAVKGIIGGFLSLITYGIVVWAQDRIPLSVVAALRETSVVWGVVLSVVLLRERINRLAAGGALIALAGAILVDLGG